MDRGAGRESGFLYSLIRLSFWRTKKHDPTEYRPCSRFLYLSTQDPVRIKLRAETRAVGHGGDETERHTDPDNIIEGAPMGRVYARSTLYGVDTAIRGRGMVFRNHSADERHGEAYQGHVQEGAR